MSTTSNLGNVSTGNFTASPPKKGALAGTKEFLQSNSIVAKVAFFLLVLEILQVNTKLRRRKEGILYII